ncbi:MAG: hypothetical protein UCJ13_06455, partial [Bacteroidaceae bacterium]|nr:hypothetical protein [Bacteroidaceae bacterium]
MGTTKTETKVGAEVKKTTCAKPAAKKTAVKKSSTSAAAAKKTKSAPLLKLIKNDPYLQDYAEAIQGRNQYAMSKISELTNKGKTTLSDFASGYLYFGLHKTEKGWVIREWAPNATELY